MQGMGGGKVVHLEGQMKFIVTQIVRFFAIFEPG
jgi:hypothetical protein